MATSAATSSGTSVAREYDLFAVTAHGLADLCAAELMELGISGRVERGGVSWTGDASSLYRANLELRTASRIIARIGEFRARGFPELERHAAKLQWNDFIPPGAAVTLRVTCRKSRLYHEGAVAERIARVIRDRAHATVMDAAAQDDDADDAGAPGQLIIVRFMRDVCTISADSSGALLHQRGYRQAVAKAPLRETIAAALLLASGWRGDTPLIDPLCGSGTIPIEAALLARRIAPGIAGRERMPRSFAFQAWPHFDNAAFATAVDAAQRAVHAAAAVTIIAADRDAGAITAARSNAARAGVEDDIEFRHSDMRDVDAIPGRGHVVTNPPYGVRVGERRQLRVLYQTLGATISTRLPHWDTTMLAADETLAAATGLPLAERLSTRNGGIPVRLMSTTVVQHTAPDPVYEPSHHEEETQ